MDYDDVCRNIDWAKLAKARVTVKNLAAKKASLKYLADLLDRISETAVDEHGVPLNTVYPSANNAILISNAKKYSN